MWDHLRCETTKLVLKLWYSYEHGQQKALKQVFHTCHYPTLNVTVNGDRWGKRSRCDVVSELPINSESQIKRTFYCSHRCGFSHLQINYKMFHNNVTNLIHFHFPITLLCRNPLHVSGVKRPSSGGTTLAVFGVSCVHF
jgi:hypothetical protein